MLLTFSLFVSLESAGDKTINFKHVLMLTKTCVES